MHIIGSLPKLCISEELFEDGQEIYEDGLESAMKSPRLARCGQLRPAARAALVQFCKTLGALTQVGRVLGLWLLVDKEDLRVTHCDRDSTEKALFCLLGDLKDKIKRGIVIEAVRNSLVDQAEEYLKSHGEPLNSWNLIVNVAPVYHEPVSDSAPARTSYASVPSAAGRTSLPGSAPSSLSSCPPLSGTRRSLLALASLSAGSSAHPVHFSRVDPGSALSATRRAVSLNLPPSSGPLTWATEKDLLQTNPIVTTGTRTTASHHPVTASSAPAPRHAAAGRVPPPHQSAVEFSSSTARWNNQFARAKEMENLKIDFPTKKAFQAPSVVQATARAALTPLAHRMDTVTLVGTSSPMAIDSAPPSSLSAARTNLRSNLLAKPSSAPPPVTPRLTKRVRPVKEEPHAEEPPAKRPRQSKIAIRKK